MQTIYAFFDLCYLPRAKRTYYVQIEAREHHLSTLGHYNHGLSPKDHTNYSNIVQKSIKNKENKN